MDTTPKRPAAGTLGFQVFTGDNKETYVRIVSANNETLMVSEGYTEARDAFALIVNLQEKVPTAQVFDLR